MTASTLQVVTLAVLSAFCYAAAAVLQQKEARAQEDDAAFLVRLAQRPAWLAGLALNAAGFAFQALALRHGDLVVVQPLLLLSVVFSALLASMARHEAPSGSAWAGVVAVTAGLAVFFAAGRPGGGAASPVRDWAPALVATGGAAVLGLVLARSAPATMLGIVSGILFGLAATLTKVTVDSVARGVEAVVLDWPVYALALSTALAFVAMQKAFQAGPLVASFPALIALDPLVASLLGAWLYGEGLQGEGMARVVAAGGVLAVVAGIRVLASSSLLAPPDAAPTSRESPSCTAAG